MTMLMVTATVLPDVHYTALGIVIGDVSTNIKQMDPAKALEDLEKAARKLSADAVIGIQFLAMTRPSITGQQNLVWAIGTAIKFR